MKKYACANNLICWFRPWFVINVEVEEEEKWGKEFHREWGKLWWKRDSIYQYLASNMKVIFSYVDIKIQYRKSKRFVGDDLMIFFQKNLKHARKVSIYCQHLRLLSNNFLHHIHPQEWRGKNKNRQIILRDASLSSLVLLQINISRVRLGCVMERVEKFSIFLFLSRSLTAWW